MTSKLIQKLTILLVQKVIYLRTDEVFFIMMAACFQGEILQALLITAGKALEGDRVNLLFRSNVGPKNFKNGSKL
jgi:hypothetical protein